MLVLTVMVFALAVVLSGHVFAQVSNASLNGVVRDPSGAVIPNATIVLHNVQTSVENTTVTNRSGVYSLFNITPGSYTLEITAAGFRLNKVTPFTLTVSQVATLNFALAVESQSSVVTVQASSTQLDVTSASLGTVIGKQQVNDLPLNGRNFTELLALTPGVSPVNTAQNAGGGFKSASVINSEVIIPSINGQGNRSNMFLLDRLTDFNNITSFCGHSPQGVTGTFSFV